jgi:hypothetical protein
VGLDAADLTAVRLIERKTDYPFETPALELEVPATRISGYDELAEGRFTPAVPLYYRKIAGPERIRLQPYATTLTRITAFPDLCERKALPVVAAAAVGPYPYNQRQPLASQTFEPEFWSDEEFLRGKKTAGVQRNADFYFDLERHYNRPPENQLAYLQFRIWSDHEGTATFALGASSAAQCFLDGKELFLAEPVQEAELMKVACARRPGQFRKAWGAKLDVFVNG